MVDVIAALIIQLVLILTGGPDPNTGDTVASVGIAVRMVQTLSFFTIQSNILVLIVAITLVFDPARMAVGGASCASTPYSASSSPGWSST